MKKIIILITAALMLCGCTPKVTDERTMPKCFSTTAKIEFDDMVYEALMERLADGWWKVELTAPEAVKGLVFDIKGEDTEIGFKGLHFTFDTQKFPVGSVIRVATRSFDRLAPLTLDVVSGEKSDFASGNADGMAYSVTLDKSGTPLSLELGDCGMKISFSDFMEIDETEPEPVEITDGESVS